MDRLMALYDDKRILPGIVMSVVQYVKTLADRIDPNNPTLDHDRGVKLNDEGYIDGEFGGNIFPVKYQKIDSKTQRQFFPDGSYFDVVKVDSKTYKVYDDAGNLIQTITNNNGIIEII